MPSSAASAGTVVGAPFVRSFAAGEVRDKVRVGVVGLAARGAANLAGVAGEHVAALCEIDEPRAAKARAEFPQARVFTDHRRMFDAVGGGLDAVVVSTPDHTHAPASLRALAEKKHLYCEKPLARSVADVRAVRTAAAKAGVVTQMGTQIHAGENYRRVVEFVRSGRLGEVSRVEVWFAGRPPAGKRVPAPAGKPGFDLDAWLGPVPAEFFYASHGGWPHFHWRWWWEFGGGTLADMGCHYLDLAFWALGLTAPTTVTAAGSPLPGADNGVPEELAVRYTFPYAGRTLPVTWHHGNPGPHLSSDAAKPAYDRFPSGVAFHTAAGVLVSDYAKHRLFAAAGATPPAAPDRSIPKSAGHHAEWLTAIRGEGKPLCPVEYAGPLTEAVLLGNVAYRAGEPLTWDAAAGRVTNSAKAAAYTHPPVRAGWGV